MAVIIDQEIFEQIFAELSISAPMANESIRKTLQYVTQYLELVITQGKHKPSYKIALEQSLAEIKQLSECEDAIQSLDIISSTVTKKELSGFTTQLSSQIIDLKDKQTLLLPGGWNNSLSSCHMIYKFIGHSEGIYLTIYNASGDFYQHETISAETQEKYYPVTSYLIPFPINQKELGHVLTRLITPRLRVHSSSLRSLPTGSNHPLQYVKLEGDQFKKLLNNSESEGAWKSNDLIILHEGKLFEYRRETKTAKLISQTKRNETNYVQLKSIVNSQQAKIFTHSGIDFRQIASLLTGRNYDIPNFNTDRFYEYIKANISFLKATPLLVSTQLNNPQLAISKGQKKNDFQLTINELMKLNFKNTQDYYLFSMDFKLHALIKFHENNTHSTKANNLILNACKDTLSLLNTYGIFDETNSEEFEQKKSIVHTILGIKEAVAASAKTLKPSAPSKIKDSFTGALHYIRIPEISAIIEKSDTDKQPSQIYFDLMSIDPTQNLIPQLTTMIANCTKQKDEDPRWVLIQLEQLINQLPLPENPPTPHSMDPDEILFTGGYDCDIPLYSSIKLESDYDKLTTQLDCLQKLHVELNTRVHQGKQRAVFILTQCSFLALRDYFDVQSKKNSDKPTIHHLLGSNLKNILTNLNEYRTYLATNNPSLDQRFEHLFKIYLNDSIKTPASTDDYLYKFYHKILESALVNEVSFIRAHYADSQIFVRGHGQLQVLFNCLDERGNFEQKYHFTENHIKFLLQTIRREMQLKQFIHRSVAALMNKEFCFSPYSIGGKWIEPENIYTKRFYIDWFINPLFTKILADSKVIQYNKLEFSPIHNLNYAHVSRQIYNVSDATVHDTLINKIYRYQHRSENEIQLIPSDRKYGRPVTAEDSFKRQLYLLRSSKENQVQLVINFFKLALDKLSDPELQRYVEASIFDPKLLCDVIKKDREGQLFSQFDSFIAAGKHHFTNEFGQLQQTALFFIRLSVQFDRYVSLYKNSNCPKGRLKNEQKILGELIQKQLDPMILVSLHEYRFLTIMSRYDQDDLPADEKEIAFSEAYHSYFHLQALTNPLISHDKMALDDIEYHQYRFKFWLQSIPKSVIINTIAPIVRGLGIEVTDTPLLTATDNFPIISFNDPQNTHTYKINTQSGRIFTENKVLASIPVDLQKNIILKELDLEKQNSCFISEDGQIILFLIPNSAEIRLIRKKDTEFFVHKKWEINQTVDWYQLFPLSFTQNNKLFFSKIGVNYPTTYLPELLKDSSYRLWVKVNGEKHTFITQNNVPRFQSNPLDLASREQLLQEINPKNQLVRQLKTTCDRQADFTHFEDNKYFTLCLDAQNNGEVNFSRYGLSFTISNNTVTLLGADYQLLGRVESPFSPEVACLTLTNTASKQCIVAVQRFYLQNNAICHDISSKLYEIALKSSIEKMWNYNKSEKTITYNIHEGKPRFEKAFEGLYLCYLYLVTNETDKAFDVLNEINKGEGLTGSFDELTYLTWIIHDLTPLIEQTDTFAGAIVCQLKALSLLTDFLRQGFQFTFPELESSNPNSANEYWKQYCYTQINSVYENIPQHIYELYSKLQSIKSKLPHSMFISSNEGRSLLNYYQEHPSPHAPLSGALGYEWRTLNLELVQQWNRHLRSLEHEMSPKEQQELAIIDKELSKQVNIMKKSTLLELKEINFSISLPDTREKKVIMEAWDVSWTKTVRNDFKPAQKSEALALLSSNLDDLEKKLPEVFPIYLSIAIRVDNSPEQKSALRSFCENYIRHHYHGGITDQNKELFYWMNVLYRVIQHFELNPSAPTPEKIIEAIPTEIYSKPLTGIMVYQPKQVFDSCLASSQTIWERLQKQALPILTLPTPKIDFDKEPYAMSALIQDIIQSSEASGDQSFVEFCTQYRSSEINYQLQFQEILKQLPENPTRSDLNQAEQKAGKLKFICIQQQRLLAENYFISPKTEEIITQCAEIVDQIDLLQTTVTEPLSDHEYDAAQQEINRLNPLLEQQQLAVEDFSLQRLKKQQKLIQATRQFQQQLKEQLQTLWDNTLCVANQEPQDPKDALRYRIQRETLQQPVLNKQHLLKLYLNAEQSNYLRMTALSEQEIKQLHARIHRCVTLEVQEQHLARLIEALDKSQKDPDNRSKLHEVATVLMSEIDPIARDNPALMVHQYEENILLRPSQAKAMEQLYRIDPQTQQYHNSIQKLSPGAGKTTLMLPGLAEAKATGLNLVIYLVPRALLPTNHAGLNTTTQNRSGKKGYRFEFNRDSDSSSNRLKQIYHQFREMIINKNYLISTAESMQSLDLKYQELLLTKPTDPDKLDEWHKQVHWAAQISHLIKQRGDAIFDEIHEGLLLKKKLNYTLGTPCAIDPGLIRQHIQLYTFLDMLAKKSRNPADPELSRQEMIENQWPTLLPELVDKLLEDSASPLFVYLKKLYKTYPTNTVEIREQLKNYLLNEADCAYITGNESVAMKDTFAFYKEQLDLLPKTLARHHKEHYGPSKSADKNPLQKTIGIPYAANDKPSERSRFANSLETINYSIQSLMLDGLNSQIIKELVLQWQRAARLESANHYDRYPTIDSTPTAELLETYLKPTGLSLGQIDPRNEAHITQLMGHLQYNDALIFTVLEEKILGQLSTEPEILHSNAYNHVEQYNTVQGLSATPANWRSMHPKLQFDFKTALGSDGYILEVLRAKKTPVHTLDFKNIHSFLNSLESKLNSPEKACSIIDICATFSGINNLEVAQAIAQWLVKFKPQIQYVLYFNDEDVLCALDIKDFSIKELRTSKLEKINELLKCGPEARFSYYDQARATGTDLTQMPDGNAIVLENNQALWQRDTQGTGRQRLLDKDQTVEIIVPSSCKAKSLEDLIKLMIHNEDELISNENFEATLGKMENLIRCDLRQRVDALTNEAIDDEGIDIDLIEKKHQWTLAFKPFLVETQESNLWEQYGAVNITLPTQTIFENHQKNLLEQWKTCLAKIDCQDITESETLIAGGMTTIIQESISHCKPEMLCRSKNTSQGLEVEVQKEVEVAKVPEVIHSNVLYDQKLIEKRYEFVNLTSALPLNTWCGPLGTNELSILFPSNLKLTNNFAWTHQDQKELFSPFMKSVHAIYFTKDQGALEAYLITNREMDEIQTNRFLSSRGWITTTQHCFLGGNKPKEILDNPEYQELIESIRFFNGEISLLLDQDTPYQWINEKSADKLAFCREKILPNRFGTASELSILESILSKKTQAYAYILENLFEDLTQVDWNELFPGSNDAEVSGFHNLACALHDCNQKFPALPTIETLRGEFALPPTARLILQNHLTHLKTFSEVIEKVSSTLSFDTLDESQIKTLNYILQLNVKVLIDQSKAEEAADTMSREFININVLMALIQSPLVIRDPNTLNQLHDYIQRNLLLNGEKIDPITPENILLRLFANEHKDLTAKHFEQLQKYPQTTSTLLAQLHHRFLSKDNVTRFFKEVKNPSNLLVKSLLGPDGSTDNSTADVRSIVLLYALLNRIMTLPVLFDYIGSLNNHEQCEILTQVINNKPLFIILLNSKSEYAVGILILISQADFSKSLEIVKNLSNDEWSALFQKVRTKELETLFDLLTHPEAKLPNQCVAETYKRILQQNELSLSLLKKMISHSIEHEPSAYQNIINRAVVKGDIVTWNALLTHQKITNKNKVDFIQSYLAVELNAPLEQTLLSLIMNNTKLNEEVFMGLARKVACFENLKMIIAHLTGNKEPLLDTLIKLISSNIPNETLLIDILKYAKEVLDEPSRTRVLEAILNALPSKILPTATHRDEIIIEIAKQASRISTYQYVLTKTAIQRETISCLLETIATKPNLASSLKECIDSKQKISNVFLRKIQDYKGLSPKLLKLCAQGASPSGEEMDSKHKIVMTVNELLKRLVEHSNCDQAVYRNITKNTFLTEKDATYSTANKKWGELTARRWNQALKESGLTSLLVLQDAQLDMTGKITCVSNDLTWLENEDISFEPCTILLMYAIEFYPEAVPFILQHIEKSVSVERHQRLLEQTVEIPTKLGSDTILMFAAKYNSGLIPEILNTFITLVQSGIFANSQGLITLPTERIANGNNDVLRYLLALPNASLKTLTTVLDLIRSCSIETRKTMLLQATCFEQTPLKLALKNKPEFAARLWFMLLEINQDETINLARHQLSDDDCTKLVISMENEEQLQEFLLLFEANLENCTVPMPELGRIILVYCTILKQEQLSQELLSQIMNKHFENTAIYDQLIQRVTSMGDPNTLQLLLSSHKIPEEIKIQLLNEYALLEKAPIEPFLDIYLGSEGLNDAELFQLALKVTRIEHFNAFVDKLNHTGEISSWFKIMSHCIKSEKFDRRMLLPIIEGFHLEEEVPIEPVVVRPEFSPQPVREITLQQEMRALVLDLIERAVDETEQNEESVKRSYQQWRHVSSQVDKTSNYRETFFSEILTLPNLSDDVLLEITKIAKHPDTYSRLIEKLTDANEIKNREVITQLICNLIAQKPELLNLISALAFGNKLEFVAKIINSDFISPSVTFEAFWIYALRIFTQDKLSDHEELTKLVLSDPRCNEMIYSLLRKNWDTFRRAPYDESTKSKTISTIEKAWLNYTNQRWLSILSELEKLTITPVDSALKKLTLTAFDFKNLHEITWPHEQDHCDIRMWALMYAVAFFPKAAPVVIALIEKASDDTQIQLLTQTYGGKAKLDTFGAVLRIAVIQNPDLVPSLLTLLIKQRGVFSQIFTIQYNKSDTTTANLFEELLESKADNQTISACFDAINALPPSIQLSRLSPNPEPLRILYKVSENEQREEFATRVLSTIVRLRSEMAQWLENDELEPLDMTYVDWSKITNAQNDENSTLSLKLIIQYSPENLRHCKNIMTGLLGLYENNEKLRSLICEKLLNTLASEQQLTQEALILWSFLNNHANNTNANFENFNGQFQAYKKEKEANSAYFLFSLSDEYPLERPVHRNIMQILAALVPSSRLPNIGLFNAFVETTLPWMLLTFMAGKANSEFTDNLSEYSHKTAWNKLIEHEHSHSEFITTLLKGLSQLAPETLNTIIAQFNNASWIYLIDAVESNDEQTKALKQLVVRMLFNLAPLADKSIETIELNRFALTRPRKILSTN